MNIPCRDQRDSVPKASVNIILSQFRIIISGYFSKRKTLINQLKDILNGDARPGNTRLAKVDVGINGNFV